MVASLVVCIFAGCSAGCSTTATISRTDRLTYEANILGSDANSLRVRDGYGPDFLVPREVVADIDHPGNVNGIIGSALVAFSAPFIIGDIAHRGRSQGSDWSGMGLVIGIPSAITGLCLAIPGWLRYRRSKRAAKAFEDANPILPVPGPPVYPSYPAAPPYLPPPR
jgi:hypothetical protein